MPGTSGIIIGNFLLREGERVTTANNRQYTTYHTSLSAPNGNLNADIRVYSPPSQPVYGNGTIVFVVGKFYAPPSGTVLIEVTNLSPYPGDEDSLPSPAGHDGDITFPTVIVVGHVLSTVETLPGSTVRGFLIRFTDYVRDTSQTSTIQCRIPETRRWTNTPTPYVGSACHVYGYIYGRNAEGLLALTADNITIGITSLAVPAPVAPATATATATGASPTVTPRKRARLGTYEVSSSSATPSGSQLSAPTPSGSQSSAADGLGDNPTPTSPVVPEVPGGSLGGKNSG